jgi:hypothetical protein
MRRGPRCPGAAVSVTARTRSAVSAETKQSSSGSKDRTSGVRSKGGHVVARLAVCLPKHPDEHSPQRPVLLAVDQQLGLPLILVIG